MTEVITQCDFAMQTNRCNGHPCCIHKCQSYDKETGYGLRDEKV